MKKKCSKKTHDLVNEEKKKVMKETLEHLKQLKKILGTKEKVKFVA